MGIFKKNMKTFAIAALLGLTNATILNVEDIEAEKHFLHHIDIHGLSYGTVEEFEFRKAIFMDKFRFIKKHNADANETHKVGFNHFMTWTDDEYKKLLGGKMPAELPEFEEAQFDTSNLKDEVNWVTAGKVSDVKNQGQCGSCWAFSTTGSAESASAIEHNSMPILSEQQLVDCDTAHDMGCNGGNPIWAYQYLSQTPAMRENDYPYVAKRNSNTQCSEAETQGVLSVTNFNYKQQSESQFMAAIAQN